MIFLTQKNKLDGTTPLHHACTRNDSGLVKYLIGQNADPNATTKDGRTPLLEAAASGHLEVVKCLKANGTNIEFVPETGNRKNAIGVARVKGKNLVVKYLAEQIEIKSGKGAAVKFCKNNNDSDTAKYLIEHLGFSS